MHKNVNFWFRLLINFIDFTLFFLLSFLLFWLIFKVNKQLDIKVKFSLFAPLTLINTAILFIILPLFFKGRSIGMIICRKNLLFNNQAKLHIVLLKKSVFNVGIWLLFLILYSIIIYSNNYENFINSYSQNNETSLNLLNQIITKIIVVFSSFWMFVVVINYLIQIFSKTKLSLLDRMSESRIVFNKHFELKNDQKLKLIPYRVYNKKYEYHYK